MDFQIPLMIIDRRGLLIMSMLFTNRRVTHLRFAVVFEWIRYSDRITGPHEGCFRKVPKLFRYIEITQGGILLMFVN
jgi:hypothetical protein